jgi:hypothetical protein
MLEIGTVFHLLSLRHMDWDTSFGVLTSMLPSNFIPLNVENTGNNTA